MGKIQGNSSDFQSKYNLTTRIHRKKLGFSIISIQITKINRELSGKTALYKIYIYIMYKHCQNISEEKNLLLGFFQTPIAA